MAPTDRVHGAVDHHLEATIPAPTCLGEVQSATGPMLKTLAIRNYRSLLDVVIPLGQLNVVTGANGSGKSNLYRALRLLADTARSGVVGALAAEGGLPSTFWAGPDHKSMKPATTRGVVQGGRRSKVKRLSLGFASEDFGYAISLGHNPPVPLGKHWPPSAFDLDPEIKRECIWYGDCYHPTSAVLDRKATSVKVRPGRTWEVLNMLLDGHDSVLRSHVVSRSVPGVMEMRQRVREWRFYDHFRTDRDAPSRQSRIGTRTPVLHPDGGDLPAALQTIIEVGHHEALAAAIADAFPGASIQIDFQEGGRFALELQQSGLLRPLSVAELSEGTLLYLLWVAALLTPRPPPLMVLNEPETSLHTDLLPALARLIGQASETTQIWVITHSPVLAAELASQEAYCPVHLEKHLGQTLVNGQTLLEIPSWRWPDTNA